MFEAGDSDMPKMFDAKITVDPSTQKTYLLNIENRQDNEVVSRHGIELIDDRGVSMMDVFVSVDQRFASKSANVIPFSVNTKVPDGYYIVRAKIAFVSPNNDKNSASAESYLEVIDGQKTIISQKDFYHNSLINVAIQEPIREEK